MLWSWAVQYWSATYTITNPGAGKFHFPYSIRSRSKYLNMHNIYPIHFIVAHYIIYIYSCCYAFAPIYFGAKTTNRCIKKLLFLLDCHRPFRFLHPILNLSVLKIFLQLIQTQTIILNTIVYPLKEAHQEVGS